MDVRKVTDVADCMILASGNSDRHVRSIADRVVERAKAGGFRPMGIEGERDGEWVLVDLNDVIVHVMLPRVREFYGLEELWEAVPPWPKASRARPSAKAKAKREGHARKGRRRPRGKAGSPRTTAARGKKATRELADARLVRVCRCASRS